MSIEQALQGIPDKREWKTTTSLELKRDLYRFFNETEPSNDLKAVELGTHHGHTTRVLSFLFKEVRTYDIVDDGQSKKFNASRKNITHVYQDIYETPWWEDCDDMSVVFVDAVHKYGEVSEDIDNCLKIPTVEYIVFDDYGLFPEVKRAVIDAAKNKKIVPVKYIGEPPGSECRIGKSLFDWEGIICRVNKGENNE